MKLGAFDYLTKPFTPPDLLDVVERAMEHGRLNKDLNAFAAEISDTQIETLIGRSPAMLEVAQCIRRVAPFKSTVLVEGESGTGKELVVRAIHQLSTRKDKAFIAFNCAAVPANLVESELFGHERGALPARMPKPPATLKRPTVEHFLLTKLANLNRPFKPSFYEPWNPVMSCP